MKAKYLKPHIFWDVCLCVDASILATSVVDDMTVATSGQEVMDYDFSDDTFNTDWEN